jgi:uncharacterized protein YndB with AHSA1/START domain
MSKPLRKEIVPDQREALAPEQRQGEHWPSFPDLQRAETRFPTLLSSGAYTVARDRWERLVSQGDIAAPPERVWNALTDPSELRRWLAVCHGSLAQPQCDCVLDFEDGEFFLCQTIEARSPGLLKYYWRWLGIGQATTVTWQLEPTKTGTRVTVTEEAINPPWDWQTWNGGGWPEIINQLAGYLRTGLEWRWPWRRMGPYTQVELPASIYETWDQLTNPAALKYWLLAVQGSLLPNETLQVMMGDASGMVEMKINDVVQPGQSAPSFLPYMTFALRRQVWGAEVGGRLWVEPAGWGRSLLQVFHYNWENLPAGLQLSERKIITSFWSGAFRRAKFICRGAMMPAMPATAPHNW